MDSVGGENAGSLTRKVPALQAGVVADGDRLRAALGFDPVGNALGGLADHIDIHAVGAGAKCAAQTRSTKFQRDGKPVFDGLVVILDVLKFFFQVKVFEISGQPSLIFLFVHCHYIPFSYGTR